MAELEKVIRGLRDIDMFIAGRLEHEKAKNFLRTIDETIILLKEQEAKQEPKPVYYETNSMTGLPIAHCPSCKEVIKQYAYGDIRKTYYCQYCGQAVKWE